MVRCWGQKDDEGRPVDEADYCPACSQINSGWVEDPKKPTPNLSLYLGDDILARRGRENKRVLSRPSLKCTGPTCCGPSPRATPHTRPPIGAREAAVGRRGG